MSTDDDNIEIIGAQDPQLMAGGPNDDDKPITDLVEQPAKVMRIGTMIKQLLEEVKAAPLDDDGETYLNLAKVLYQEDRVKEAAQAAQQALDKGVSRPDQARDIINASR